MSDAALHRTAAEAAASSPGFMSGISLTDDEVLQNRLPFYRAMRANDPVHFDEKMGMYLVSRYEDIRAAMSDPITFSVERGYVEMYAHGYQEEFQEIMRREGGGYFPDAIITDPPYHTHIRRLMERAFTAHRVKTLQPRIEKLAADLVEKIAAKGEADGVAEFATPLTIGIMCEQLGISHYDAEKIRIWSMAVTAQIGGTQTHDEMVANARLICELQHYIIACMREREHEPREDMISDLIHAKLGEGEGSRLTFGEVVSLVRALIVAGNDTTTVALTNLLFLLATQKLIAQRLQESVHDDRNLGRFVEELLRVEPPVHALFRMTTKEVELGGVLLPEGAQLLMLFASANDDDGEFADPRQFDMDRPNLGRQLAFGTGPHRCIGVALARMEIKVAAREIGKQLAKVELTVPVEELRFLPTVSAQAMEKLPLRFTRQA